LAIGPPGSRKPSAHRDLVYYLLVRFSSLSGAHMLTVALGWQIYELTDSPMMLGIAGLIRFFPAVVLFPIVGYVADRFPRLVVFRAACALQIATVSAFFLNSLPEAPSVALILAMLVPFGVSRAFLNTALRSVLPSITTREFLSNAIAYNSTVSRLAAMTGPIIGGFAIGLWGGGVYLVTGACYGIALVAVAGIGSIVAANGRTDSIGKSLFAGLTFLLHRRMLLSTIMLDFTTVVIGTVIALLPVFAKDILEVGPEGLGLLRAMPAIGSVAIAAVFSQVPVQRSVGAVMFACLFVNGGAIVVFGLSTSLWLSLAALAVYGGADMVGIILRQSLLQHSTPNDMRGRVAAIDSAGSNGSEELGNFRAGMMAAAMGPQAAVIVGGCMAILITVAWVFSSPGLRRLDRPTDLS